MKSLRALLVVAMAIGVIAACEEASRPVEAPKALPDAPSRACENALAGRWQIGSVVSRIIIDMARENDERVLVEIPDRDVAQGSVDCSDTGGGTLQVDFADDPGCCGGTLSDDGRSIQWSNGTTWTKQ